MADIDQIIAGGAGAGTTADFSGIPKLLDYYWKGKDEAAKNDLREAFKGGVPLTPDGQPDFAAMAKTLFQKGGLSEGTAAANLGQQQQNMQFGQGQSRAISGYEGGQPVSPPSANRTATAVVAPPLNKGGVQGLPADQQQDPNSEVFRMPPAQAVQDWRNNARPTAPQQVAQVPQQSQVAQAPQQAVPQGQPAPVTNAVTTTQAPATPSRIDQGIAFYAGIMSNPQSPKQNVELAKERLKSLQDNSALTPLQKEYSQAVLQGFKGTMQDFANEQESGKAGATERAKNDVAEQKIYIDQGRQAATRLGTLNLMTNIIQSDKNLDLGFGSQTTLKIKMALERVGIDTGDLSGSQLLAKYNSILAAESTKGVTSRGTNFDMKTFMANNPGLGMDEKGNIRMLGILSQNAKREYELGKLARQNQDNWNNWDNVVEAYDKRNPIKDPTTGKILSSNSIIAPGPTKATTPASGSAQAAPMISSKADYDKLPKGAKFTGPDGKPWQKP
jgi:hypothetical protein